MAKGSKYIEGVDFYSVFPRDEHIAELLNRDAVLLDRVRGAGLGHVAFMGIPDGELAVKAEGLGMTKAELTDCLSVLAVTDWDIAQALSPPPG